MFQSGEVQRLLLVAAAGMGKTDGVLTIARQSLKRARRSFSTSIPIVLAAGKWVANSDRKISDWVGDEYALTAVEVDAAANSPGLLILVEDLHHLDRDVQARFLESLLEFITVFKRTSLVLTVRELTDQLAEIAAWPRMKILEVTKPSVDEVRDYLRRQGVSGVPPKPDSSEALEAARTPFYAAVSVSNGRLAESADEHSAAVWRYIAELDIDPPPLKNKFAEGDVATRQRRQDLFRRDMYAWLSLLAETLVSNRWLDTVPVVNPAWFCSASAAWGRRAAQALVLLTIVLSFAGFLFADGGALYLWVLLVGGLPSAVVGGFALSCSEDFATSRLLRPSERRVLDRPGMASPKSIMAGAFLGLVLILLLVVTLKTASGAGPTYAQWIAWGCFITLLPILLGVWWRFAARAAPDDLGDRSRSVRDPSWWWVGAVMLMISAATSGVLAGILFWLREQVERCAERGVCIPEGLGWRTDAVLRMHGRFVDLFASTSPPGADVIRFSLLVSVLLWLGVGVFLACVYWLMLGTIQVSDLLARRKLGVAFSLVACLEESTRVGITRVREDHVDFSHDLFRNSFLQASVPMERYRANQGSL